MPTLSITAEPTAGPKLLVNSREAAAMLGLSDRGFRELAYQGQVPSFKVGRRRLFKVTDLERWVAQQG